MTTLVRGIFAAMFLVTVTASMPSAQGESTHAPVTKAQLAKWSKELSNWGRWGKEDQLATLNLITPAKRKQAASLVKEGISISLGGDFVVSNPNLGSSRAEGSAPKQKIAFEHTFRSPGFDTVTVELHYSGTHLDSHAHRWACWSEEVSDDESGRTCKATAYNGYVPDAPLVMKQGHPRNSIYVLKDGVLTRGVLMDMARLKGVPYLKKGTKIYIEDLEAWEKKAGIKVSAGDALVVRMGGRAATVGGEGGGELDESVLPWVKQRDVAMMVGDRNAPLGHFTELVMGTWNINLADLEALSQALAARNRWEFMFSVAPMQIKGGTASPVNPTATF